MKRTLLFMACMLAALTMSAQNGLNVGDIQNIGCLSQTKREDAKPAPTIVLTKEGNVLSVQLLNYETYDTTTDFNVTSSISDDDPCSVTINVVPVIPQGAQVEMEWVCLFNVSFAVRNLEPNRFYLDCWWYKGLVELTEGKPLVLEYKIESVIIDGISFNLLKVMHKAKLTKWTTAEKEIRIPSEVTYGGENYIVTCIDHNAFGDLDYVTTITIPKTIRSTDLDVDGIIWANPFRECKSLEWIEVEEGCPLLNSVDGVLFAGNKTMLLGYPIASPRETYTVPEGVTIIRSGAFHHNKYLRKLVIPEEVTYLGWHLFNDTKCLEEIYIKGVLNPECMDDDLFGGMSTNVNIYVLPSEVDKFKAIYKGPVYPLPEKIFDDMVYRPFVEEGKVWKVGTFPLVDNSVPIVDYYYFDGDTIIDGKTCKQMMCQQYVNPEDPDYAIVMQYPLLQYVGAWYEEDKKVYFYNANNKQMRLMYDFSLDDNGLFHFFDFQYVVGPKQTGGINGFKGVYREVWECGDGGNTFQCAPWMEGVGLVYGPPTTNVFNVELADPAWYLMSCTVGDEVIYYNSEEEDPYAMGARKRRIDFTHTIKIQPKARTRNGAEESIYGEYNDQQLCINIDPLDDTYLVRITDESGKAVYEKNIYAGNIVGLNIDISAYTEGRYTVSVENSLELFTGEFGAQMTGIKEVSRKQEVLKDHIYNLQGQRINTLQKGLNIVNGQKVFVK